MEAQQRCAQVPQWLVLAVLLGTLLAGGVAGYTVRSAEDAQSATERIAPIPRAQREGVEIASFQGPVSPVPRVDREGPERSDGTR